MTAASTSTARAISSPPARDPAAVSAERLRAGVDRRPACAARADDRGEHAERDVGGRGCAVADLHRVEEDIGARPHLGHAGHLGHPGPGDGAAGADLGDREAVGAQPLGDVDHDPALLAAGVGVRHPRQPLAELAAVGGHALELEPGQLGREGPRTPRSRRSRPGTDADAVEAGVDLDVRADHDPLGDRRRAQAARLDVAVDVDRHARPSRHARHPLPLVAADGRDTR